MCFSAVASFGTGVVLSAIGVVTIKKAKSKSQIMFASIPLIFAVQQITEGFVWLSLSNPDFGWLQQLATYNFLFFAQVVWPLWTPYSILKLEPKERRRKSEEILVALGVLVSLYLAFCLINYRVKAKIIEHHIVYDQDYPPSLSLLCGGLYVIATILPPFLSRIRHMWMLGATILISYFIATLFYTDYLVSVWCFFSSIISMAVFAVIHEINNPNKTRSPLSTSIPPNAVTSN